MYGGGWRGDGGESSGVLKGQDIRAVGSGGLGGGGVSELNTAVIIKISSFAPCAFSSVYAFLYVSSVPT